MVEHDLVEDKKCFFPKGVNTKNSTKKRSTKKYHALDLYICFCFVCIIIYTIVHTVIFYQNGIEATVLDALFYGVFGGEVLICALLKRLKLKQEFELKKDGRNEESVFSGNKENTFIDE